MPMHLHDTVFLQIFILIPFCRRPALGVEGRSISLKANHLEVNVRPGYIYQYRVSIIPSGCPRRVNRDIMQTLVDCYSGVFRTEI